MQSSGKILLFCDIHHTIGAGAYMDTDDRADGKAHFIWNLRTGFGKFLAKFIQIVPVAAVNAINGEPGIRRCFLTHALTSCLG